MSSMMKKASDAAHTVGNKTSDAIHTIGAKMGLSHEQPSSDTKQKKKLKQKGGDGGDDKKKELPQQQPGAVSISASTPSLLPESTLSASERSAGAKELDKRTGNDDNAMITAGGKGKTLTDPLVLEGNNQPKILPKNHAIVFMGEGKVELKEIPYPQMKFPWSDKPITNGVILKVLTSAICGSDLHPYHGRTLMQSGCVLGHEFCGEVVECGPGVQKLKVGDWGCVPFNCACGTCDNCVRMRPECCDLTNNQRHEFGQGGLYGYICGGGWQGGQAEYVFVPFADYNILQFHDKAVARSKLLDLTLLTDILPTAMNGVVNADVQMGSTVFITGAGPVGLLSAQLSLLKGAAAVIVADHCEKRLARAKSIGCYTINMTGVKDEKQVGPLVKEYLGVSEVDCFIECVGYEAYDAKPLNIAAEILRSGAWLAVPGVYAMGDPKGTGAEKKGQVPFNFGKLWMKGTTIRTGQTSVVRYNRGLMSMILHNRIEPAKLLDVKVVSLEGAVQAYKDFSEGAPHKYIIDPFNTLGLRSCQGCSASSCTSSSCSSLSSSSCSSSCSSSSSTSSSTLSPSS